MNKNVIGLRQEYMLSSLIASIAGMAGLVLPYAAVSGTSVNLLAVLGGSGMMMAAVAFTVLSAVLAVVNYVKPSIRGVNIWVISLAVQTALFTMLLFSSKGILDGMGVFAEKFLVKNFGIGYWLAVIVSYVALVLTMKMAKINTGYIVLVILSVIWLFPVLWIILTALREEPGFYVGYFFPKGLTLKNFTELFAHPDILPFGKWYSNTLIVAVCTCMINTLLILGTAFVLSRTRFKGRKAFMNILMIIGMFPGFLTMILIYKVFSDLGLTMQNAPIGLIIVYCASSGMGYYVSKGFFDTIPKALDEAAIIDGANRWQIFTKITIPLSKPIAIYTLLTGFLGTWSDYIFPSMLFGDNQANYTVAIGLKWMTDFRRIENYYTQFAAGALIIALPIVILFICLQKYYVEGLSGAVKG